MNHPLDLVYDWLFPAAWWLFVAYWQISAWWVEKRLLSGEFGGEFAAYRREVPSLVPFLRHE